MPRAQRAAHTHETQTCMDKWICRAAAGDDPARALADRLQASLLPPAIPATGIPGWIPSVLQLRETTPGLSYQRPDTLRDLLGRSPRTTSRGGLKCQHHSGTGQSRPTGRSRFILLKLQLVQLLEHLLAIVHLKMLVRGLALPVCSLPTRAYLW